MEGFRLYVQLKWAVRQGKKEQIESLLLEGAPVNDPSGSYKYHSPLLSSVYLGDLEVVRKLLSKGASVDVQHLRKDTALTLAAKFEKYAIVDLLLTVEELKNSRNCDHLSHLHIASMRNNVGVVRKLIQSKKDINAAVDNQSLYWPGFTPLHFAVRFRCIETVEYLLSIGADITIKDARQLTPLHLANMQRSEQIIDLILSIHTNVVSNPKNSHNVSHFHIACTRNNPEVVEFFFKTGVDIQDRIRGSDFDKFAAIDLAIFYGCSDVVKILLNHQDHIKSYDTENVRLINAYDSGNMQLADSLLMKSRAKEMKSIEVCKIPKLHISCMGDDIEIIKESFSESAGSLDLPLENGCTPLLLAVQQGNREAIEFLMKQGADCSIRNKCGDSPLHLAFEKGDECVELILDNVSSISKNSVNSYGLSYLHILCAISVIRNKEKILSFIEHLIKLGSDVNGHVSINSSFWAGFSPLHFAVKSRSDDVVQILLENGACYSALNRSDLSALDLCIEDTSRLGIFFMHQTLKIMERILSLHLQLKLHSFNDRGFSLLHILSFNLCTEDERLRELIEKYPSDINKVVSWFRSPFDGYTPLHFAMRVGDRKRAELLIERGADIVCRAANGDTPLHLVFQGDEFLETSISLQDPDILRLNPMGSTGYSLFHVACGMGDINLMKCFFKCGVDVNSRTISAYKKFYDKTPLHIVLYYNPKSSEEALKLLLDNGADVHSRDSEMSTPLHYINFFDTAELIDILINHGADIDALNMKFETPILRVFHSDVTHDSLDDKMILLLNHGADINIDNDEGDTPMTVANEISDYLPDSTVDILLKHVAKLQIIGFFISITNQKAYAYALEKFSDKLEFDEASFKNRCSKELEELSKMSTDRYTTLVDILSKNLNQLASISENDAFAQIVVTKNFQKEFPIYGPMLESRLRKGQVRRPRLEEAQRALCFISGCSLPEDCAERIFESFTNEDLQFVILSCKMPKH